ncbi:class I SAM-dependent methyltransferase [Treponema pedis]|uniref:Class I SAM-dependent methyltransferase n=1 Tax=Treponema pedis TaxID=409322 RepID=A0A7S6WM38_9SPIR|nr:class I SAM-dependent methyltransferase [Treponema pedis]QOW59683.1 class I SAM-dependent methyltransferase [Treponema pedis]QSI05062.1 rRNA (guanine-N2)-methyltransferase [Treponema pedis]
MGKDEYQAELFKNRIKKRFKHLSKWAKREGVFAYRLYDKDIPEVPVALDIYFSEAKESGSYTQIFLVLFLYKRPYEKLQETEEQWLSLIANAASKELSVPVENIFIKLRQKQSGNAQYEKLKSNNGKIIVREGECLFYVNLEDYLDTGLFLDHRPARLKIFKEAENKTVLNLFSYTGSFSVHALAGGARAVYSVDLSNTYSVWAKENFILNNLYNREKCKIIKSDVIKFLKDSAEKKLKWDLIICDPPTFSNSKSAAEFDVNKDWLNLCLLCLSVLETDGTLYFSSNSLKLKFNFKELNEAYKIKFNSKTDLKIKDLTEQSIPEDFRNKKIHKLWSIMP